MNTHEVRQGECLSHLALRFGHIPKTIWDLPANAPLRTLRKCPDVLLPGDLLSIPEIRPLQVDGTTERCHRFRRKSSRIQLHLRLRVGAETLAHEPYEFFADGLSIRSQTDGDGIMTVNLSASAESGWVRIRGRKFTFMLGALDPLDTVTGQQQRLRQLGHDCGPVDGLLGPKTAGGFRAFQKANGLPVTGASNRVTLDQLNASYGC